VALRTAKADVRIESEKITESFNTYFEIFWRMAKP
jgi:hypothetical protein